MSKGSVYLKIQRIGRVITIWDEVSCKLRVSIDGLVTRKKVFLYSSNRVDTNIYVDVDVLKSHSSVSFEVCIDEEFIESWLSNLMFQSPHATNFLILSSVQLWIYPGSWYHSGMFHKPW